MKKLSFLCLISILAVNSAAFAREDASPELERIKALAGKWEGSTVSAHEENNTTATVEYSVTSGGSAVIEKLFPDTPHEMTSIYFDKGGKLTLAHYCMLGNQPELTLQESTPQKINLSISPASQESLTGQMRMEALQLEWTDDGDLVHTWVSVHPDGQPSGKTIINLKRSKAD